METITAEDVRPILVDYLEAHPELPSWRREIIKRVIGMTGIVGAMDRFNMNLPEILQWQDTATQATDDNI